jgi:CMP-N,N'-diacetyllegionaminic acid synthase
MSTFVELLAVIPARSGSKGIVGKNIKPFRGQPLISYTIKSALESQYVQQVLVSTDDLEIVNVSKKFGAFVPFMRSADLATDEAKSIDVLIDAVNRFEELQNCKVNHIILLQPTSPLRDSRDIDAAYTLFLQHGADSLQSVTEAKAHPYLLRQLNEQQELKPFLKYEHNLRRQEVEVVYQLNGAIYIMKRDLVMEKLRIIGDHNIGYVMPQHRSVDIDDIYDFKYAEMLMEMRFNQNGDV